MMEDQSNSFISYSSEEIRLIGKNIVEILNDDILKVLSEIKENNLFIRRKSPVKLKYSLPKSVASTWRKEKEIGNQLVGIDLFNEKLNSNLNKISNSNYAVIQNNILELLKEYNDQSYQDSCLSILFSI